MGRMHVNALRVEVAILIKIDAKMKMLVTIANKILVWNTLLPGSSGKMCPEKQSPNLVMKFCLRNSVFKKKSGKKSDSKIAIKVKGIMANFTNL